MSRGLIVTQPYLILRPPYYSDFLTEMWANSKGSLPQSQYLEHQMPDKQWLWEVGGKTLFLC
jgi:hypothetical protein